MNEPKTAKIKIISDLKWVKWPLNFCFCSDLLFFKSVFVSKTCAWKGLFVVLQNLHFTQKWTSIFWQELNYHLVQFGSENQILQIRISNKLYMPRSFGFWMVYFQSGLPSHLTIWKTDTVVWFMAYLGIFGPVFERIKKTDNYLLVLSLVSKTDPGTLKNNHLTEPFGNQTHLRH